jgi:hypothetical protein
LGRSVHAIRQDSKRSEQNKSDLVKN